MPETTERICPLCERKTLQNWEKLCGRCWKMVEDYDEKYGTNHIQKIKAGGLVIFPYGLVIEYQTCYYPLTPTDRMARVKKLAKFCGNCDTHDCSECWVHWMMNHIAGVR